jgi:PilZ domain-containing protein
MGEPERRRHRRFALRVPMELIGNGATSAASLFDLSEGGAFLTTRAPPPTGVGVYMRFHLHGDTLCEATGYVVRTMPFGGETGVAVQFGHVNDGFVAFLRNLAAALEAGRPDLLADVDRLAMTY